jgi:hypothetical protein
MIGLLRSRRDRHGRTVLPNDPIGSIRRECLDHTIVLGEGHLRRLALEVADLRRPEDIDGAFAHKLRK